MLVKATNKQQMKQMKLYWVDMPANSAFSSWRQTMSRDVSLRPSRPLTMLTA